jgi:hypothetical protein
MAASTLAGASVASLLSCRRALRGGEASVSGQSAPPRAARCRARAAGRGAVRSPSALLRVRDDLRAPGVVTWTQARALRLRELCALLAVTALVDAAHARDRRRRR